MNERYFGEQTPAVGEKKHPGKSARMEILTGQLSFLPRIADLAQEDRFISFLRVLGSRAVRRYGQLWSEVLPAIIGQEHIITLVYRRTPQNSMYFVATRDWPKLQEAFSRSRTWLEQRLQETLLTRKTKEPKRPVGIFGKLTPEKIDEGIVKIRKTYGEGTAIFYSHTPHLRQLLGISRYTLNEILMLARGNKVVPAPRKTSVQIRKYHINWASYSREEIIAALEHLKTLRSRGENLFTTAQVTRREVKASSRLTISQAARQLGVPIAVFHRLIGDGKISLGNPAVDETARRLKAPHKSHQQLIDPAILEKPEILEVVDQWTHRHDNLDPLTHLSFQRNRHLYATVLEVAKVAGLHPISQRGDAAEIARKLAEKGINNVALEHKNKGVVVAHYLILLKKDFEAAVEILREDRDFDQFRPNPVVLVCGPQLAKLPNTYQLFKEDGFSAVGTFLRFHGIEVGRFGRRTTIDEFFGPHSPVSIIRRNQSYYFPASQKETMEEFAQRRKHELFGN